MAMNNRTLRPRRKAAAVTGSDPYWSQVSLLLHMDGADGSTTLADSSQNALAVTVSGNAQMSTAQSKFGGASVFINGSGKLTITDNTAFQFGTGDFTAELWAYVDQSLSTNQYIFDFGANNGVLQILNQFGFAGAVYTGFAVNTITPAPGGAITSSAWTHFAVVRKTGETTLYVNGVSTGSGADASNGNATALTLGQYGAGAGYGLQGYIDELRITKGAARYTSNFTPPTAAFPNG